MINSSKKKQTLFSSLFWLDSMNAKIEFVSGAKVLDDGRLHVDKIIVSFVDEAVPVGFLPKSMLSPQIFENLDLEGMALSTVVIEAKETNLQIDFKNHKYCYGCSRLRLGVYQTEKYSLEGFWFKTRNCPKCIEPDGLVRNNKFANCSK